MEHGLLPINVANQRGLNPTVNDLMRLDGRLNGTSLSISFPNGSMFYGLRMNNPGVSWAIIAVSTSVLWSKDVLFCRHNAADARISKALPDALRKATTFASLFDEIEGFDSRSDQGLKDFDPTDVQAEALVMDTIEPEFLLGAVFNSKDTRDQFAPDLGKRKLIVHNDKKGFFANRTYHRKWGGG